MSTNSLMLWLPRRLDDYVWPTRIRADHRDDDISSIDDLLRAFDCENVQELEDTFGDFLDAADLYLEPDPGWENTPGIEIQVPLIGRGTFLSFPFPLRELDESVAELELEVLSDYTCRELADQIFDVEGLLVEVAVDYDADLGTVKPKHRRWELTNGVPVQFPLPYPYKRPMRGDSRFQEWVRDRFERHYPGLDVRLAQPGTGRTSLKVLRGPPLELKRRKRFDRDSAVANDRPKRPTPTRRA